MDLLLTLTVAFRALGRNKLRAGLTVLGVVIGIAAVTTMVSIGQSATALVQGQLQTLGTNVIVIFPATGRGSGVRDTAVITLTATPIDQTIRVKNLPFKVIGVLERKGANIVGEDQDDIILIPYTTVKKRIQGSAFENVGAVMVSARTTGLMADAESQIRQLLL